MEQVYFIEMGMGVDLHGQDVTKAAIRAIRNATEHNSLPGIRTLVPNEDLANMQIRIKLAVPADADKLDVEAVKAALPYGQKTVEVVDGGMATTSGIFLSDKGDKNDLAYAVIAAIEVGC